MGPGQAKTPKARIQPTLGHLLRASITALACLLSNACQSSENLEPTPALPSNPKKIYSLHGYIDKSGNFAIKPQFIAASSFNEGLAHVVDPRGSYIDKSGNFVVKETYYLGGDFHEGLAWVAVPKESWSEVNLPGERVKYGFIDKTGKIVIPAKYRFASDFSEGFALVMPEQTQAMGFIDKQGKIRIKPRFYSPIEANEVDLPKFKNGHAFVTSEDNLSFYIDKTGKALSGTETEKIKEENSYDELGLRILSRDDLQGYIDKNGKLVIPCQFNKAFPFHDGLALIHDRNKNSGFIDKNGKIVIKPSKEYEYTDFHEGICEFKEKNSAKRNWGYMDKTGKVVAPLKFKTADQFSEGLAEVESAVSEEELAKIKFPFEYTVEGNTIVFPLKLSDKDSSQ